MDSFGQMSLSIEYQTRNTKPLGLNLWSILYLTKLLPFCEEQEGRANCSMIASLHNIFQMIFTSRRRFQIPMIDRLWLPRNTVWLIFTYFVKQEHIFFYFFTVPCWVHNTVLHSVASRRRAAMCAAPPLCTRQQAGRYIKASLSREMRDLVFVLK